LTDNIVGEFIVKIEQITVDEVGTGVNLARDPKDEPYLNLAAECQAGCLVSRDRELLDGAESIAETWPNLRIVDPVAFLITMRAQLGSDS